MKRAWDIAAALLLASLSAGSSWTRSQAIDPALLSYHVEKTRMSDLWFDADLPKVFQMSTDRRAAQHGATASHPLASLALHAPVTLVRAVTGSPSETAMQVSTAGLAALWAGLLYSVLRRLGLTLFDATLFTLVGLTSAAAVFWFAVSELFAIGSLTILMALWGITAPEQRAGPALVPVLLSAATLGITVTNWSVGLLCTLLTHRLKEAVGVSLAAVGLVCGAWGVQAAIYPHSRFFLGGHETSMEAVRIPQPAEAAHVLTSLVGHTLVMPDFVTTFQAGCVGQLLSVQEAPLGSGGGLGLLAVAAWSLLLAGGIYGMSRPRAPRTFRLLLGLALALQLGVHLFFGYETFLYSMHFLPLLVATVALGLLSPLARATRALAVLLVVCGGIHNFAQFDAAAAKVRRLADDARRGVDPTMNLECALSQPELDGPTAAAGPL
ncbi:MAG: hypothetical protein KJ067_06905 [Vicinamibacteria bacterium]|nr:hypothetical protein [Vicinamibacteria bacterium]